MSAAINTGGPAFPDPGRAQSAKQREVLTDTGMTLRDYFAAKAMQPLIAGRNWSQFTGSDEELIAQWAKSSYAMADAMLAARQGGAA